MVRIMPNNECKVNVDSLLCNGTYPFTYDVKTTEPGQFTDPKIFHVNNFQVFISVIIEVQLQAWNFKPKKANKVTFDFFFKSIGLYYIRNITVAQPLTSEKRQKQNND